LHLDDHTVTAMEASGVGLGDRSRRQRFPVELGEHVVGIRAQLGGQHVPDPIGGFGAHPVLQPDQLAADVGWDEVGSGRRQLTQFDVHAAGLFEHAPQADAGRVEVVVGRAASRTHDTDPFGPGEPAQLTEATHDGHPGSPSLQWSRRDNESGMPCGGERAGAGE
jgi:hypothetical protein